jgi:hypothetical protein
MGLLNNHRNASASVAIFNGDANTENLSLVYRQ